MFSALNLESINSLIIVFAIILIAVFFYYQKKITRGDECPYCHSKDRSRVKKKSNIRSKKESLLREYKCLNCHKIFYLLT
jgi:transposase-like protein